MCGGGGGRDIIDQIRKEKDSIDVVHFHLIWFYDKNIIMKEIKRLGIRSVVTTHGTYSTGVCQNSHPRLKYHKARTFTSSGFAIP